MGIYGQGMAKIIDLYLEEHPEEFKPAIYLVDAIEQNSMVVVLGSPGSGKTSILQKYADIHEYTQFLKIKKFINLDDQVNAETKILLLDGLDEYRSVTADKTFVIEKLANKLKDLKDIKIVISSREMDWYGEGDKRALKDEVGNEVSVFSLQPLTHEQKIELSIICGIDQPEKFVEKFSTYGFLDNPQMFTMIAELYKNKSDIDLSSKAELYEAFVKGAKEKNEERSRNQNQLTPDEILRYSGYLAFYYMFTDIESFNDNFVDQIVDNSKGFDRDNLMKVLDTSLFDHRTFIHRTIAEFALAYFLVHEKMSHGSSLSNERIKSLFVKNGEIPTELRGTYAWLCSLHKDMSFISVDPYYQAIYGDNSLFDDVQKRDIVLSVKEYSETHPWFIDFWKYDIDHASLSTLYSNNLDDFYMSEFENSKSLKSHYMYFIVFILGDASKLSDEILACLREKVFDMDIPSYIVDDILKVFTDDIDFLLEVLNAVKDGTIHDSDNTIKEFLLKRLYPAIIKPTEIIDFIKLYHQRETIVTGHGLFLFNTEYRDKFQLAKQILDFKKEIRERKDKSIHRFHGSDFMDNFVSDFLFETMVENPEQLSIYEQYDILLELNQLYHKYKAIKIEPYIVVRKNSTDKTYEQILEDLANDFFSIFIDRAIESYTKNMGSDVEDFRLFSHDFKYFYKYPPKQAFEIIISKLKQENTVSVNKGLFSLALTYKPFGYDDNIGEHRERIDILRENAIKFGFEEQLDFRLSEEVPEWMKEDIVQQEEDRKEQQKILKKNESYFAKKSDEEIAKTFGDLNFIEEQLCLDYDKDDYKYLTKPTLERLKQILSEIIFMDPIDQTLTTLESLSEHGLRNIERVYYVALALNDFSDHQLIDKINQDILAYLYIVDLMHNNIAMTIESNFSENFEHYAEDKAIKILKQYIGFLINHHYPELNNIYDDFMVEELNIDNLKRIALSEQWAMGKMRDTLLNAVLSIYGSKLSKDELEVLIKTLEEESGNSYALSALICLHHGDREGFTVQMASELYNLFYPSRLFDNASSKWRIKVIDYMFSVFDTEKSIEHINGFQSTRAECASFLRDVFGKLTVDEMKKILEAHNDENDIWKNRLLHAISNNEQQEADQGFEKIPTEKLKEFILADTVLSKEDFFADIKVKLNTIKQEIEDNRNNEKNLFYNDDGTSKNEESCRDVILQKLNDKYGYDLASTKEKHEADNRVDINIKYKADMSYEVQVECKKDRNGELYTGIADQLIYKYFSSGVEYGVYTVFYFGDKKDKDKMLTKLYESIPDDKQENIEIVCIDLRK